MLGWCELLRQVVATTPVKLRVLCADSHFANCCPDGKIPTHMMKRVIVTGGAGFVGSNLVWTLQEQVPGVQIVVIDDFRTGTFANLTCCVGDTRTFAGHVVGRSLSELDLSHFVREFQPDVIFHEASITDTTVSDEAQMIRDNVEPFQVLVDCAVNQKIRLVWASSAATYGTEANGATAARRPFQLEDAGRPANVYGFSKWIMENIHRRAVAENPEAHLVGLRYFNVFGPGEQNKSHMASMIYQLALQMLEGKRPRIFTDGEQARDQVYVLDVVDATIAAANQGATSGIYNLGSGGATSFNQIIKALNEALGTNLEPDYFENPYDFYQDYTCADLSQTKAGIGWQPKHDVCEAIVEYGRWLKSHRV